METPSKASTLLRPLRTGRLFGRRSGESTATKEAPPARAKASTKRRSKILIVEDDQSLRMALKERLTHDGCDVTDVGDGVSARWSLLSTHYDAVILDLTLPSSSGVEVMNDVKRSKSLPPVLVLTGGDADERDRARAIGATFVLQKPSPYEKVREVLERMMG